MRIRRQAAVTSVGRCEESDYSSGLLFQCNMSLKIDRFQRNMSLKVAF